MAGPPKRVHIGTVFGEIPQQAAGKPLRDGVGAVCGASPARGRQMSTSAGEREVSRVDVIVAVAPGPVMAPQVDLVLQPGFQVG